MDPAANAAHIRGIARRGEWIKVQRISGAAPRTVTFSAIVKAIVQNYNPATEIQAETGYSPRDPGSISQGEREIILMASDLVTARFPVPVQKNDKIILFSSTGEKLNITRVDMQKRSFAGAVELVGVGVA